MKHPKTYIIILLSLLIFTCLSAQQQPVKPSNAPKLSTAAGAAGLVRNLPGVPAVEDIFTFMVYNNNSAGTITLVSPGTSVSIINSNSTSLTRVVYCRVTDITLNAEKIDVF